MVFSGLGADTDSGYGKSAREDGLALGLPGIDSLANPGRSKPHQCSPAILRSAAAWALVLEENITCVALGWEYVS